MRCLDDALAGAIVESFAAQVVLEVAARVLCSWKVECFDAQERHRFRHRLFERVRRLVVGRVDDLRHLTPGYDAATNAIQAISDLCNHYNDLSQAGRRALLHTILETATWQDGEFRATLKTPFAQLAHSNQGSTRKQTGNGPTGRQTKNWLPG